MNYDLEQLIAQGETDRVEFKRSFAEEKEIIETIGAFLNHKGGKIIIGYDEKKKRAVDLHIGGETVQKFINKVKSLTIPQVIVDVYDAEYKGKKLLVIDVIEYPIKPVSVQGRYYRRRINSNHLLTAPEIANLHLVSLNSSWDYQIATNASLDDLDMDTVDWFIGKLSEQRGKQITEPPLKVLEKYEIIRNNQPTFAALLLFPRNPSFILDVQIGLFEDEITIKKDKNIKKSVLYEVDEIMDFITAYITKEFIITGKPRREERWQYPLEAIRELAMNAVIHRDYQEGTHTQIKIFRDKISFWNSGKLPPDLSIRDIKSGMIQSKPRNRLLAQVFKDLGIIEKYGSGVKRVIDEFHAYGLEEPLFEERAGGFYVMASHKKNDEKEIKTNREDFNVKAFELPESSRKFQKSSRKSSNNVPKEILSLLQRNCKINRKVLAQTLNLSENTVKYHLRKLKEKGLISHTGPSKGGYWEVASGGKLL